MIGVHRQRKTRRIIAATKDKRQKAGHEAREGDAKGHEENREKKQATEGGSALFKVHQTSLM
jgi:hypothetical protein